MSRVRQTSQIFRRHALPLLPDRGWRATNERECRIPLRREVDETLEQDSEYCDGKVFGDGGRRAEQDRIGQVEGLVINESPMQTRPSQHEDRLNPHCRKNEEGNA